MGGYPCDVSYLFFFFFLVAAEREKPPHVLCVISITMTVLSQRIQTNRGFRTTHSRRSFVCRAQAPKDKAPVAFELRRNSTWSAILADKMIDAVDDIGTHVRRIIRNNMGGQVE